MPSLFKEVIKQFHLNRNVTKQQNEDTEVSNCYVKRKNIAVSFSNLTHGDMILIKRTGGLKS